MNYLHEGNKVVDTKFIPTEIANEQERERRDLRISNFFLCLAVFFVLAIFILAVLSIGLSEPGNSFKNTIVLLMSGSAFAVITSLVFALVLSGKMSWKN